MAHINEIIVFMLFWFLFSAMTSNAFQTAAIGGTGGSLVTAFDQGRISGISLWGIETAYPWNGVIIETWSAENQTLLEKFGWNNIGSSCSPFSLNVGEYIDGYHIITGVFTDGIDVIRMLNFHSSTGNIFTCSVDSTILDSLTNKVDTGWIIFTGSYLTGFKVFEGVVIDSIVFQFKSLNDLITITDIYGGNGGSTNSLLFDQGRISAILQWGYSNSGGYNSVMIMDWDSDEMTSPPAESFGHLDYWHASCPSFTLTADEYIDGYRVIYRNTTTIYAYVEYIGFHVSNGSMYSCQTDTLSASVIDTGWIISPHSFLTGFWVKYGVIIDQIGFQFTDFSLFPSPTFEPTFEPTVQPTSNPTTTAPTTTAPTTDLPSTAAPTTNEPTTSQPTYQPSSQPTTTAPTTKAPTTSPLTDGEAGTTSIYDTESGEASYAAKKSFFDDNMLLMIIICGVIGFCIIMIVIFCLKRSKKRRENVLKQNETNIIEIETNDQTSNNAVSTSHDPIKDGVNSDEIETTTNIIQYEQSPEIEDAYSNNNALKFWLNNIGLSEHLHIFIKNGFSDDISQINALYDNDLKEMGIKKLAHRKLILRQINDNKKQMKSLKNEETDKNDEILITNTTTADIDDSDDDDDDDDDDEVDGLYKKHKTKQDSDSDDSEMYKKTKGFIS